MASSRARVLAFYAAVWLVVLILGSGSLIALRQWGWSRIATEHINRQFADARDTFDTGDVIQAQKDLVTMLEGQPGRVPVAIATFNADLLAMPGVTNMLEAVPGDVNFPASIAVRRAVMLNRPEAALTLADSGGPDVALWHARLLVERGAFGDAIERFDAYWAGHSEERGETVRTLMPPNAELPDRAVVAADALFRFGLWEAAAEVAQAGIAAGAADPALGFYVAVIAERDEGRLAAIERYKRVLADLPNHALALRRVEALQQQDW